MTTSRWHIKFLIKSKQRAKCHCVICSVVSTFQTVTLFPTSHKKTKQKKKKHRTFHLHVEQQHSWFGINSTCPYSFGVNNTHPDNFGGNSKSDSYSGNRTCPGSFVDSSAFPGSFGRKSTVAILHFQQWNDWYRSGQ